MSLWILIQKSDMMKKVQNQTKVKKKKNFGINVMNVILGVKGKYL